MGKSTLEIKGFEEFYKKLKKMDANAEAVAEQTFDECMDILEEELKTKASAARVPSSLINKITKTSTKVSSKGIFYGSVGWKSEKMRKGTEASDFHKVIFLNYGTPSVKKDFIQVKIDGQWKTIVKGKGGITKRGFIKMAKNSAKRRIKALMKSKVHEILGD